MFLKRFPEMFSDFYENILNTILKGFLPLGMLLLHLKVPLLQKCCSNFSEVPAGNRTPVFQVRGRIHLFSADHRQNK